VEVFWRREIEIVKDCGGFDSRFDSFGRFVLVIRPKSLMEIPWRPAARISPRKWGKETSPAPPPKLD
jgi:hypothetical protein